MSSPNAVMSVSVNFLLLLKVLWQAAKRENAIVNFLLILSAVGISAAANSLADGSKVATSSSAL